MTAATKSDVAAFDCADEPDVAPDLIVSVTVNDANPVADQTITVHATVQNQGDASATPTTLRYYRSNDSTIDTADTELANDAVPALSASATESGTLDFRTPSTPGTFYLGACIDSVSAESRTGNNCSTAVPVTVEEPATAPDLIVSVTVNDANPVAGQRINVLATVLNQGDASATPTTLRYYRSNDATINRRDSQLVAVSLPAIPSADTVVRRYVFTVPSPVGTFYLGACVDSVSDESDTLNNCSDGAQVTVTEPAPDLTVPHASVDQPNPITSQGTTLRAQVHNRGAGPAPSTTIRFYQSNDDSTIDTEDHELGSEAVAELAAGAYDNLTLNFTVPSTPGMYYFGACIDSVSDESDTGNNCSTGALMTVRQP